MNDFSALASELQNIAAEGQPAENPEQKEQLVDTQVRSAPIDPSDHLAEIEMMTKKAEIAKKASLRKAKKKEHFQGLYEKKAAKDRANRLDMKKSSKIGKKK